MEPCYSNNCLIQISGKLFLLVLCKSFGTLWPESSLNITKLLWLLCGRVQIQRTDQMLIRYVLWNECLWLIPFVHKLCAMYGTVYLMFTHFPCDHCEHFCISVLHLIVIIKSEIWIINHYLRLGHESMLYMHSMILYFYDNDVNTSHINCFMFSEVPVAVHFTNINSNSWWIITNVDTAASQSWNESIGMWILVSYNNMRFPLRQWIDASLKWGESENAIDMGLQCSPCANNILCILWTSLCDRFFCTRFPNDQFMKLQNSSLQPRRYI